uniref:sphingomyelin phosphodiesterase 5-like isoform X1 n=1 Tax=Styela clava TaxID=7725 RepID=UPI00193AD6D1|nr:sphingomyelin phosphodiesterase 5-like isoform X1 [Styela clava]
MNSTMQTMKRRTLRRNKEEAAKDEDKTGDLTVDYRMADNFDQKEIIFNIPPGNAYAKSILPIRALYRLSIILTHFWWLCLDCLIALFIRTTEEPDVIDRRKNILHKLSILSRALFFTVTFLLLSPFAVIGFLIWLPLQLCLPRAYSFYSAEDAYERQHLLFSDTTPYKQMTTMKEDSNSNTKSNINKLMSKDISTTSFMNVKKSYVLVSGNVCLMPEFLAKLNNVSNSVKRAEKISNLLCGNQIPSNSHKAQNYIVQNANDGKLLDTEMLVKTASETSVTASSFGSRFENESCLEDEVISLDSTSEASIQWSVSSKERAVSESFPKYCDFLCLQEIFDRRAADVLLNGLRSKYPYILYDVVWPIHHRRISLLNSGLCIASKYPFLDVKFKAFPDGFREDKFACKGLLMTKVYLGESDDGKPLVGYLSTTHLQAITHTKASQVRCRQLNLIQAWLDDFKNSTKNKHHTVMFDIVCGDFNFDQESHFEEDERKCEFRRIYRDPCMNEMTGQQHNWVIGTELLPECIHDQAVNSSKGLQRMLISELERPRYVASTLPANCAMTKMSDGRRRIDYILYKPCGNKKMVIKDFKFITGFATLTDHIPLSMTFSVDD